MGASISRGGWFSVCSLLVYFLLDMAAAGVFIGGVESTNLDEPPISLAVNGDGDISKSRLSGAESSERAAVVAPAAHRRRIIDSVVDDSTEPLLSTTKTQETEERQQPPQERGVDEVGPGDKIEEMAEDWTEHASTPAWPGAVLDNARSVYSEISDEILVRTYSVQRDSEISAF